MRAFQTQLENVSAVFHKQLVQLAAAIEPARAFQDHLQHLVKAFEPARALQQRFVQLSRAFNNQTENASSEDSLQAANTNLRTEPTNARHDGSTVLL
jgi:hypothetical protein